MSELVKPAIDAILASLRPLLISRFGDKFPELTSKSYNECIERYNRRMNERITAAKSDVLIFYRIEKDAMEDGGWCQLYNLRRVLNFSPSLLANVMMGEESSCLKIVDQISAAVCADFASAVLAFHFHCHGTAIHDESGFRTPSDTLPDDEYLCPKDELEHAAGVGSGGQCYITSIRALAPKGEKSRIEIIYSRMIENPDFDHDSWMEAERDNNFNHAMVSADMGYLSSPSVSTRFLRSEIPEDRRLVFRTSPESAFRIATDPKFMMEFAAGVGDGILSGKGVIYRNSSGESGCVCQMCSNVLDECWCYKYPINHPGEYSNYNWPVGEF